MLILNSEMTRQESFSQESEILEAHFEINPIENLESTDESAEYNVMIGKLEERIQNFDRHGSNWRFRESSLLTFTSPTITVERFIPYETSKRNQNQLRKPVINLKNEDKQCFKWCVMKARNPVDKNSERIAKLLREKSKIPKWGDMKFKFEKLNTRISINVFGHEERKL